MSVPQAMPMVFWLEASAPETGELAYLNHNAGTVYFGSDNNNRLSMSHIEPPDVNQQIIMYPMTDTAGNRKWYLKVHTMHMAYIRFM